MQLAMANVRIKVPGNSEEQVHTQDDPYNYSVGFLKSGPRLYSF